MSDRGNDLARALADLALTIQDQAGTESTLEAVVKSAVEIVPGVRWAGVSMIEGRTVTPRALSDPLVAKLDMLQTELDEGPCLSSLREHRTVLIDEMTTETRWPRFAAAAVELGALSLLSFQLYVLQQNLGALNLYGGEPGVFSEDSEFIGAIVAHHASVALFGAETESQFEEALTSRDEIGQAKGIIMERFKIDSMAAFSLLVKLSQDGNVKLSDIAHRLVTSMDDETA
ncbi:MULTISPECIES: GAF and ANTAR domain-containing protein [Mycobacteriaceae]|uniref:Transcription antitermination regulator n=1 Tax=Mycolicibacterium neoaurum VKM Ac-1815D TaxID=700508 RepID=V5XBF0_MYCNE|nr:MULTISPECIES: GAF and ANTAR domain-containing protein [Mycobacteriaceae]AHC24739.1 response regulator receiver protein [Mycolicibacterium neoaurum VKM Ac-1815D]AMO05294.1 response regulator receiver protein [Mycolicibacterium neoaurum]AXK76396.1 ANTAR domain-containing protein [Mycolicibacterium neoaurum]KJQ50851.1 response regulator receiver protein [Mycolicibacterium neoaurum]KUM10057.1 response regulator receiver protein [Mycolicibacterium neoaurum]